MSPSRVILLLLSVAVLGVVAAGCAERDLEVKSRGAQLFAERCAGCHTLEVAGADGSQLGEPPTGPNLDKRKLSKAEALFAIRNGGFSGAIMPQNVVVGREAEEVAEFLAKYSGSEAKGPAAPPATGGE